MPRLRLVRQLERLHAVLKDVGEGEKPAPGGGDAAELLDAGGFDFAAEDEREPFVLVLAVLVGVALDEGVAAEGEAVFRDIMAIVIVYLGRRLI